MAPKIQNYTKINMDLITVQPNGSIRYEDKPLYIQTPLLEVRKFKSETLLKVGSDSPEWENLIQDLEYTVKNLSEERFARTSCLHLEVTEKTQIKSKNLVDLSVLDLKDNKFRAIISVNRVDNSKLCYKLYTAKTDNDVDEEPNFTINDLEE